VNSLRDLYIEALNDLYDAEQQITRALPLMAQAASHPELRQAFEEHLRQTEGQIRRLDQVFSSLGQAPGGKPCRGVAALIEEAQEKIQRGGDADTLDAFLIAAAQKVEHYEIAGYGTARTWAVHMGDMENAELLQQTADEEGETDRRLTRMAEARVNREAMQDPQSAAA